MLSFAYTDQNIQGVWSVRTLKSTFLTYCITSELDFGSWRCENVCWELATDWYKVSGCEWNNELWFDFTLKRYFKVSTARAFGMSNCLFRCKLMTRGRLYYNKLTLPKWRLETFAYLISGRVCGFWGLFYAHFEIFSRKQQLTLRKRH